MSHTKGPWNLFDRTICDAEGNSIVEILSGYKADLNLMAAAPEMLEILEALQNEFMSAGVHPLHDKAMQIIKKAKGGA